MRERYESSKALNNRFFRGFIWAQRDWRKYKKEQTEQCPLLWWSLKGLHSPSIPGVGFALHWMEYRRMVGILCVFAHIYITLRIIFSMRHMLHPIILWYTTKTQFIRSCKHKGEKQILGFINGNIGEEESVHEERLHVKCGNRFT